MPVAIAIAVALGTAITATALYREADRAATRQRNATASHMRASIVSTLQASVGRLQELASAAGEHWPRGGPEFTTLAEGILRVTGVERVALLRYLTASERQGWERTHGPILKLPDADLSPRASASARPPLNVGQRDAHDVLASVNAASRGVPPPPPRAPAPQGPPPPPRAPRPQRVARKARYFVLERFLGRGGEALPLGIDVGTSRPRAAALLAAGASGSPRASPPTPVDAAGFGAEPSPRATTTASGGTTRAGAPPGATSSPPHQLATELYVPVYSGGAISRHASHRLRTLTGFIATRYRYDTLARNLDEAGLPYSLRRGTATLIASGAPLRPRSLPIDLAGQSLVLAVGTPPADLSAVLDTLIAGGALTILLALIARATARRERYALNLARRRAAERALAQSALAVAENRFRTAFSHAPIGMALVSLQGSLMQVNHALARIVGREEHELIDTAVAELLHPEDRDEQERALAKLHAGEIPTIDGERRFRTADGGVAWVSTHTTLVRDEQERPAYFLSQIEDVSARRRYESRLQHLAEHDPLTGLLNRRAYDAALRAHIESVDGRRGLGGVIVLDIDDFKQVNDTLGHSAGDDLIARVAAALSARLRSDDVIARLGGDEFAILLRSGTQGELERLANELLEIVREQRAARGPGGRERPITASLGVAPLSLLPNASADEVLSAADLAMYDAKEAGRNRAETYGGHVEGEGRQARIESHLAWVERIRAALDEDALVLHAQPVAVTTTSRMTQYELLIRMRDEDGSLIPPGRFLPVAERYGLVKELDRWVIKAGIALLREQLPLGRRPIAELNLSGQSLSDPDLAEHVARELQGSGVLATQLVFEVTETAAIGNMAAARSCAEQLHALGCRFALDDFGAGFGSFYYLKHLPFDFIKIDGEFVRKCVSNATDRLVVKAVVDLARGLGKRTVAEFVGDAETLDVLRDLGVDYAQGFHIGKPAPLDEWLAAAEDGAPRPDLET